jgi:hypothetical protein
MHAPHTRVPGVHVHAVCARGHERMCAVLSRARARLVCCAQVHGRCALPATHPSGAVPCAGALACWRLQATLLGAARHAHTTLPCQHRSLAAPPPNTHTRNQHPPHATPPPHTHTPQPRPPTPPPGAHGSAVCRVGRARRGDWQQLLWACGRGDRGLHPRAPRAAAPRAASQAR